MPEVDAYFTFAQFVKQYTSAYWTPEIEGAYAGQKLFDQILEFFDSELSEHFKKTKFLASSVNLRCIL
jgi:hypothetical protein